MEHIKLKLLLSSLVASVALQVQAEAQKLPRLVVCITVDQLRSDYLAELSPLMGEGGLKQMLRDGQVYSDVAFPIYRPNVGAATATIFTGTSPRHHGFGAVEVFDRNAGRYTNILTDNNYVGSYTRDNFSPKNLLVETLGDRLKSASGGTSLVYSVAPTAEGAIASAGIYADGAYWLDDRIASWSSSNYYTAMLPQLEQYNRSNEGPNKRIIAGLSWKPLKAYPSTSPAYNDWSRSFHHRFTLKEVKPYKESGLVNEEVTTFALKLLESAGYGTRKSPGLLSLSYSVKPYGRGELEAEDVDTYLRLDAEIEKLLKALDREIGLRNCLITLSGTGYTNYSVTRSNAKESKLKRVLNVGRITALTNMYLTAVYGPGDWIQDNHNGCLYLNRKVIDAKKLDLGLVQRQVASFLSAAEGIDYALSSEDLDHTHSVLARHISESTLPRYRADVYWSVLPSWQIEDAQDNPLLIQPTVAMPAPVILFGGAIEGNQRSYEMRDARDIVRVICSILRIRPPTA